MDVYRSHASFQHPLVRCHFEFAFSSGGDVASAAVAVVSLAGQGHDNNHAISVVTEFLMLWIPYSDWTEAAEFCGYLCNPNLWPNGVIPSSSHAIWSFLRKWPLQETSMLSVARHSSTIFALSYTN